MANTDNNKNKLRITAEEWQKAEQYFQEHPQDVKMRKPPEAKGEKGNKNLHSFVKLKGKIWAIANGEYVGRGGKGKVKFAQDKEGAVYVVKITGTALAKPSQHLGQKNPEHEASDQQDLTAVAKQPALDENQNEQRIAELLQVSHGQVARKLDAPVQLFKEEADRPNYTVDEKIYTILEYIPGREIDEEFYYGDQPKTPLPCLLVLIKSALAIDKLHELGVVHADIKEQNFRTVVQGSNVSVKEIDYGFSKILEKGQKFAVAEKIQGTQTYMAPEIMNEGKYSFSSDTYALGRMFERLITFGNEMREEHLAYKKEAVEEQAQLKGFKARKEEQSLRMKDNPQLQKYQAFWEAFVSGAEITDPNYEVEYQGFLNEHAQDPAAGMEYLEGIIINLSPEAAAINKALVSISPELASIDSIDEKITEVEAAIGEYDLFIDFYSKVQDDYDKTLKNFLAPTVQAMMAEQPEDRPALREVLLALRSKAAAFLVEDDTLTPNEKTALNKAIRKIDNIVAKDVKFLNTHTGSGASWTLAPQHSGFVSQQMNLLEAKALLAKVGCGTMLAQGDKYQVALKYGDVELVKENYELNQMTKENVDLFKPTQTAIFSAPLTTGAKQAAAPKNHVTPTKADVKETITPAEKPKRTF